MSGADGARELRAKVASPGGWGAVANADEHPRYIQLIDGRERNRRRCDCGCGGKCTHVGCANGLGMTSGCEWSMRQWVRDPNAGAQRELERYRADQLARPNWGVRCGARGCEAQPAIRPAGWTMAKLRKVLREDYGWACDKSGDFCPAHASGVSR